MMKNNVNNIISIVLVIFSIGTFTLVLLSYQQKKNYEKEVFLNSFKERYSIYSFLINEKYNSAESILSVLLSSDIDFISGLKNKCDLGNNMKINVGYADNSITDKLNKLLLTCNNNDINNK